jgi:hypothetical protein
MPRTADPAAHEAHEFPLADRLANDAVRAWLDRHAAIALAASPDDAAKRGVDHLHQSLNDYWYALVPELLGTLRRAGLIT